MKLNLILYERCVAQPNVVCEIAKLPEKGDYFDCEQVGVEPSVHRHFGQRSIGFVVRKVKSCHEENLTEWFCFCDAIYPNDGPFRQKLVFTSVKTTCPKCDEPVRIVDGAFTPHKGGSDNCSWSNAECFGLRLDSPRTSKDLASCSPRTKAAEEQNVPMPSAKVNRFKDGWKAFVRILTTRIIP